MRFPGQRIAKHYFPVARKQRRIEPAHEGLANHWYIVGLDQVLADIEVYGSDRMAREMGLAAGESVILSANEHSRLLARLAAGGSAITINAGGAVGNTLNNFVHLSGEPAVLLGSIDRAISPHSPAFHYVAQTPQSVVLDYLVPIDGSVATAVTIIGPDGERSFAVGAGISNAYPPEAIPVNVVRGAAAVLTTLYCLRNPEWPIAKAALRMMQMAREASVPVALGMGTASLVRAQREQTQKLLQQYVTLAAMNAAESEALTGQSDVLLACQQVLDWVDIVIITEGSRGLTMGGYVDETYRRETDQEIRSKSIPEYNRWEYSRLMRRSDCQKSMKVFSHIHPYRGGPERMANTSGAGDAALAAVLHDIAANCYHRTVVPESGKHAAPARFLTYSSLSRNAQYGNRVAYEVLQGRSPRLDGPVGPDEEGTV